MVKFPSLNKFVFVFVFVESYELQVITIPPQSHQILCGPLGLHIVDHKSKGSHHAQPEAVVMLNFLNQSHHSQHSHHGHRGLRPCHPCRHHHNHLTFDAIKSALARLRLARTNTRAATPLSTLSQNILPIKSQQL